MSEASDPRLHHPHVARNREPILDVLRRVLPARGLVLEVASGSGEHAAFFATGLPSVSWQPSDMDAKALASIAAFRSNSGAPNLLAPVRLDVTSAQWPIDRADAIVNCNMIHISPWTACEGLVAGAKRILPVGGVLYLYGPYRIDGRHTASSNEEFDTYLRGQNAAWGIRDLGDVTALAADHGLTFVEAAPMPANNLSVIFRRAQ
jgi:SAM-dependent methyltransferase